MCEFCSDWLTCICVSSHVFSFQIFEMGVEAIPLSIDLWVAYLDANLEIIHGQDDYEIRMRRYILWFVRSVRFAMLSPNFS